MRFKKLGLFEIESNNPTDKNTTKRKKTYGKNASRGKSATNGKNIKIRIIRSVMSI